MIIARLHFTLELIPATALSRNTPQLEKDEKKIGRTIWGLVGLGAFGHNALTENAAAKSTTDDRPQNLIITTTKSHRSKQLDSTLDLLKPSEIIRAGGAGYKALLVLEGAADSYFFPSAGCKVKKSNLRFPIYHYASAIHQQT